MTETNYTKVFSGSFIIVQLAMDRLKSAGINAIIKDESESGRLAGFGSSIQNYQELYVNKDELSEALPIINGVKQELEENNEDA
ncbi:putative signal transducing protein [Sediminibacter sp. Hel_I_10]|uniref:putative signal transducing protein n=1 Tax=Sediminibacter sp. Hel_I_10 TaxID=1392490 RepID=UPI0004792E98|nr:DUF2007 domain-containing protein [Sediminibacter sp. Hel_I_10]